MKQLVVVNTEKDIFPQYKNTPIGALLTYHNLEQTADSQDKPELVIGTCMDHRIYLKLPEKFAYVIRTGGANMRYNEFHISYALALASIQHIAIIGHNDCGMANVYNRKDQFVDGLKEIAGWKNFNAEVHFDEGAPEYGIEDELEFVLNQAQYLRKQYPKVQVSPLLYRVEDNLIYQIKE